MKTELHYTVEQRVRSHKDIELHPPRPGYRVASVVPVDPYSAQAFWSSPEEHTVIVYWVREVEE